ncbi:hypothetical protein ACQRDX_04615 [Streptococcus sp. SGI.013]|uniref:Uncharacterized protein n=1 Tax=Streptococcus porcorum TaxID=701526 RepID=A0ABV2JJC9_9STRE
METNVLEKITQMRQKYIENKPKHHVAQERVAFQDKKILKIQKKLAALELEKCQRRLEARDVSVIEEKINKQRELYGHCCQKR